MTPPSIREQRAALRAARIGADRSHRILFVGRVTYGPTDVVASLARALDSLGHTVFHLDPALVPEVLDNPSGASGGFGPILLRVDRLTAILDTFRPQVLVVCAGGMVLDDAGAAECAARGIVTIGMTFSDPDNQDSVIDHVARFDYHTTNAELALERYEAAGIRNTFLLPFGIDRSFILSEVDDDPSLTADVVCIANAVGRPDAREVMNYLARRLDVRVYGNGWNMPGAEPVSGERLIQAARAGRFHVNFPGTRAGFMNVECGVFESVAAGGVVCVPEFDEMARLFRYGSEVVGYEAADDLAETLESLLGEPETVEAMRRRAFHRLVTEHLYEHRWIALFESIRSDVASREPRVGSRAAEVERILSVGHPEPRTVLCSGYFGRGNRGDDLLLEALAEGIERELPGAQVVVATASPAVVELRQGRPAFDRNDPEVSDEWAARASALVLGPGGLWDDYSIRRAGGVAGLVNGASVSPAHLAQLAVLVRAHGGHVHAFGMGAGPLRAEAARDVVRFTGDLAASVVVRDTGSAELLAAIPGWHTEVEVAPDVCYALSLPDTTAVADGAGAYIAVNVRPWEPHPDTAHRVLDAIAALASELGMGVVGVPMQDRDEAVLRAWADAGASVPFSILPVEASLAELTSTLRGAAAVVSMRLHTSLLAHRLGTAAVGVAYDPKVAAHFADVGRADWVVPLPVDGDLLIDHVRRAVAEAGLPQASRRRVREREKRAGAAVRALAARLAEAPLPGPATGLGAIGRGTGVVARAGSGSADLSAATVTAGNTSDPSRTPGGVRLESADGDRFHLEARAPRRGDYVTWSLSLPAVPGVGRRIEMVLRPEAKERRLGRGNLMYEVVVDGQVLFQQDVNAWSERNTVWIGVVPEGHSIELAVRLLALRDVESGGGPAAAVAVHSVRAAPWSGRAGPVWGASSPAAVEVTSRSPSSPAGGSSGARPVGRRARRVAGRMRLAVRRRIRRLVGRRG